MIRNAQIFCAACVHTPAAATDGTSIGASVAASLPDAASSFVPGAGASAPASGEDGCGASASLVEPQPIAAVVVRRRQRKKEREKKLREGRIRCGEP